jgi:hypothetical protein
MNSIVSQMNDVARRNGKQLAGTIGLNQDSAGFVEPNTVSGDFLISGHHRPNAATDRTTVLGNFLTKAAGDGVAATCQEA